MTQPTSFAEAGVGDDLTTALAKRDITAPFPVQRMVIPLALEGRDVQVKAPTGSGKTLAFGLPIIEAISDAGEGLLALVLAPTRELAGQIHDELRPLADCRQIRMASVVGGVNLERQAKRATKAHLIVATPGRLTDLESRGAVDLSQIEILVLDEADRMLDMGFLPQVSKIVKRIPDDRQTMLFSATLGASVSELARRVTRERAVLQVEGDSDSETSIAERLEHEFVACNASTRSDVLLELLGDDPDMTIIFCRTKRGTQRLADRLVAAGIDAGALHGDLNQAQRNRALKGFGEGRTRILVATDVASRGIDLEGIELVVNYDPPEEQETYTHRVGRTARAGRSGRAITLVSPDQSPEVGRIALRLGLEDEWSRTGYGPPAPLVVYRSRGNRSVFAPPRQSARPVDRAKDAPRRANRVKRGSRPPV